MITELPPTGGGMAQMRYEMATTWDRLNNDVWDQLFGSSPTLRLDELVRVVEAGLAAMDSCLRMHDLVLALQERGDAISLGVAQEVRAALRGISVQQGGEEI